MEKGRDVLREILQRAPGSIRELARAAGVDVRLLTMIRDGDRRLTAATREKVTAALRRWSETTGELADRLEASDIEPGGTDG